LRVLGVVFVLLRGGFKHSVGGQMPVLHRLDHLKHAFLDFFRKRLFCQRLAHNFGRFFFGLAFRKFFNVRLQRIYRKQRFAMLVIDKLRVNVRQTSINDQARLFRRPLDAVLPPCADFSFFVFINFSYHFRSLLLFT